jgi:hypothetical protein
MSTALCQEVEYGWFLFPALSLSLKNISYSVYIIFHMKKQSLGMPKATVNPASLGL